MKLRLDLITPEMEKELAKVLTFGAEKYSERGWEDEATGPTVNEHLASALRHIHAHRSGVFLDDESGELHLAHAFTRLGMAVTVIQREDDEFSYDKDLLYDEWLHEDDDELLSDDYLSNSTEERAAEWNRIEDQELLLHYALDDYDLEMEGEWEPYFDETGQYLGVKRIDEDLNIDNDPYLVQQAQKSRRVHGYEHGPAMPHNGFDGESG